MKCIRDSKARKILVSVASGILLLGTYSEETILKEGKTLYTERYLLQGNLEWLKTKQNKTTKTKNILMPNSREIAKKIKMNYMTKIWK